jgi:hypothetical protein
MVYVIIIVADIVPLQDLQSLSLHSFLSRGQRMSCGDQPDILACLPRVLVGTDNSVLVCIAL